MDIVINSWRDLEQFGICALTGESDKLGQRILCDLSARGVAAIGEYLGMAPTGLSPNWNSMVGTEPAVHSVLLPRDYTPLAIFLLLGVARVPYIVTMNGSMIGTDRPQYAEENDRAIQELMSKKDGNEPPIGWRIPFNLIRNPLPAPDQGLRNVHGFTGRTS
jgi:hypothetical protein